MGHNKTTMKLLDTQIISYKYNGTKDVDVSGKIIPSVVAIEFLQMQSDKPHSANYYIPRVNNFQTGLIDYLRIDHAFRKSAADYLIFDFDQLSKPFMMFSNYNISDLINTKNVVLFDKVVNHLQKDTQKDLKKKIRFILDSEISCIPINELDIEIGYNLLDQFLRKYNNKNDFRNTWNDILILSKSINHKIPLLTEDKLLNRFASELFNGRISAHEGLLDIDFSIGQQSDTPKNLESKGYINRGWAYKMKKNYAP